MKAKEELYESIVDDIKSIYGGKLSNTEAHTAARNFIEFVRILISKKNEKIDFN